MSQEVGDSGDSSFGEGGRDFSIHTYDIRVQDDVA